VVFFLGVFFKRMNAQGALWATIVGFALGLFRMFVDTPVTLGLEGFQNGYPHGSVFWIVNNIYFQYFSVLITMVSAAVMAGVSLATPHPDYKAIQSLTFETTTAEDRRRSRASWGGSEVAGSAFCDGLYSGSLSLLPRLTCLGLRPLDFVPMRQPSR
jgi:solute:Na+ symporter, SSS family